MRPIRFDRRGAPGGSDRFYLTPGVAVAPGADEHARRRRSRDQARDRARPRAPAATASRGRTPRPARARRAALERVDAVRREQGVGRAPASPARDVDARAAVDRRIVEARARATSVAGSSSAWCTRGRAAAARRASAAATAHGRRVAPALAECRRGGPTHAVRNEFGSRTTASNAPLRAAARPRGASIRQRSVTSGDAARRLREQRRDAGRAATISCRPAKRRAHRRHRRQRHDAHRRASSGRGRRGADSVLSGRLTQPSARAASSSRHPRAATHSPRGSPAGTSLHRRRAIDVAPAAVHPQPQLRVAAHVHLEHVGAALRELADGVGIVAPAAARPACS